jgi:hypothetical protein
MRRFVLKCSSLVAACVSLAVAAPIFAGPLTPPAPPAPTLKTLDEVRPGTPISAADFTGSLTITEPGLYYFTEDITLASAPLAALNVQADNVTIDLNGFTYTGPGASGPPAIGIVSFISTSTVVRNGRVRQFSQGISLLEDALVENVMVEEAGTLGIRVGSNSTVRRSHVTGITGVGLVSGIRSEGNGVLVEDCIVRNVSCTNDSMFFGVSLGTNSVVRGSIVDSILAAGSMTGRPRGIFVDSGSIVTNTSVQRVVGLNSTDTYGISTTAADVQGNWVTDVSANTGTTSGIEAVGGTILGNRVRDIRNSVSGTAHGISATGNSVVVAENTVDRVFGPLNGVTVNGIRFSGADFQALIRDNEVRLGTLEVVSPTPPSRGIYIQAGLAVVLSNNIHILNANVANSAGVTFNTGTSGGYAAANVTNRPVVDQGTNVENGTSPAANVVY